MTIDQFVAPFDIVNVTSPIGVVGPVSTTRRTVPGTRSEWLRPNATSPCPRAGPVRS